MLYNGDVSEHGVGGSTLALARWNCSSLFSSSLRSDCFSCSSSVRRFCSLRVSEVSIPRVTSCMKKKCKPHEMCINEKSWSDFWLALQSILCFTFNTNNNFLTLETSDMQLYFMPTFLLRRRGNLLPIRRTLSCRCTLIRCCCGWNLFSCGQAWRRSADEKENKPFNLNNKLTQVLPAAPSDFSAAKYRILLIICIMLLK